MESFPGIWHESVKLTMELLKSLRRHLIVRGGLGQLNCGMSTRGEVLCHETRETHRLSMRNLNIDRLNEFFRVRFR